jgi:site-specific DNA-methyltransferase (adenine-specific)
MLHYGDCFDVMPGIADNSVDMILADLPYGTTQNKWDSVIPLGALWAQYNRLLRANGTAVFTAAQPFTTTLIASNMEHFRYCWVWDKVNKYTDFLNAKRRPMKRHEDIVVFAKQAGTTYNPQMVKVEPYKSRRSQPSRSENYGKVTKHDYGKEITEHNPCSVLAIPSHFTTGIVHPTQKPVALMEYLIRTYTNEGNVVLDNCMGSGTTGVAALACGRKFIGIEMDAEYFAIASQRIAAAR